MKIATHGCPICGYQQFVALEDNGSPSDEICPSCGSQSGYTYFSEVSDEHLENVRSDWVHKEKGKWWSSRVAPPPGWTAESQMRRAGIAIPKL